MAAFVPATTAMSSASPVSSTSDQDRVSTFIKRVHDLYGYNLNADDYSTSDRPEGVIVSRKDKINSFSVTSAKTNAAPEADSKNSVIESSRPPSEEQFKAARTAGKLTIQGDIAWYPPDCGSFTSKNGFRGEAVGSEVFCAGWGTMDYHDPATRNFAFQSKNTCIADHGPTGRNYELYDCGVNIQKWNEFNPWKWRDFQPGADLPQSTCAPLTLNVSFAGFGGGISFQGCKDLINMEVGAAPYHLSQWLGEVQGQQRQAGQVVILGEDEGLNAQIGVVRGYNYHECGAPWELCDH